MSRLTASKSPYFFNAGLLYDGALLSATADAFAGTLSAIPEFDVLFGPAYKGIPLAAVTCVALANKGINKVYCYNRKEKKDHGEGGTLVGAPMADKKVVIIDDVMTAGTAIREAIAILKEQPGAQLVGIVQLVDRQERGKGSTSTSQEVAAEFGVPVLPIISIGDIITYLKARGGYEEQVKAIEAYRAEYGVVA
ncbi:orotate phosphoribosyltransferase [Cutaneotrichosporon oleaginosum]|uniref:orotate phosphoribosyltransferase n=1 Tax=Cutaneotrichosporon oleaginosum TaxID=879819 RepID=A0A0J1B9D5_9TREE|nr:orotate phosphoribosyltransferase [Cutaneotrichosporon oleaginosum]KLT44434.1 orotate phosphoribosyltransferase [Cutaneotrichosporon oleaginosum]TXT07846.1 hypothetical protein COLE_04770 [Cutaneotrichosporon oleaginosum]